MISIRLFSFVFMQSFVKDPHPVKSVHSKTAQKSERIHCLTMERFHPPNSGAWKTEMIRSVMHGTRVLALILGDKHERETSETL